MLLQMAVFTSFYGLVIFHWIYVPHLLYPLICRWTFSCFHVLAIVNSAAVWFVDFILGFAYLCFLLKKKKLNTYSIIKQNLAKKEATLPSAKWCHSFIFIDSSHCATVDLFRRTEWPQLSHHKQGSSPGSGWSFKPDLHHNQLSDMARPLQAPLPGLVHILQPSPQGQQIREWEKNKCQSSPLGSGLAQHLGWTCWQMWTFKKSSFKESALTFTCLACPPFLWARPLPFPSVIFWESAAAHFTASF